MKWLLNGTLLFFCLLSPRLNGINVPYSEIEVKTDTNKISNFYRVSPPDSTDCDLKTEAWLWHTSTHLFILCELEITEDFVTGSFAAEDASVESDFFRVQLISDLTNLYSYTYLAYPLGSKSDYVRSSDHELDRNWNSNYSYTTNLKIGSWTILYKIPFKDIRRTGNYPFNWKILLTRHIKSKRTSYSSAFCLTKMGYDYFRKANDIVINNHINKSSYFNLNPYLMFDYDIKNKNMNFDEENIGLDIAFKPNVTTRIKLSLSPDYSDIPLDNVIDSYNSKYIPSYSENRYFFVEDFDAFGTNEELFYSRHIVQPEYAFKLSTGNSRYSIGILSSKDKPITSEDNNPDFFNIIAFKPVWQNFRCQFALLNKMDDEIKNYHNEVLHINPIWEAGRNQYIWSDINLSIKELNDKSSNGVYLKLGYREYSRQHYFGFSIQEMTKDYSVDMGRIYEDDFYGWNLDFANLHSINHSIFNELETNLSLSEEIDNYSNKLLERKLKLCGDLYTNHNLDYGFEVIYYKELVSSTGTTDEYFDKFRMGGKIEWDRFGWFENRLNINFAHYLFYSLQENHDGLILQYSLNGDVSKYLTYTLTLDYSVYPDLPDVVYMDKEYVISNFDLTINFSNNLSLAQGLRYDNYEGYREINGEWTYRTLYIGYFANLRWKAKENLEVFAGFKNARNEIESELETDYCTLFAKLKYRY